MKVLIDPFAKRFVLSSIENTSCMAKLLRSFTEYPQFFRMVAFQNIANYLQILKDIEKNENLPSHFALLNFFDARFADQAKVGIPFILVYEVTLKFLTSHLSNVALYRSTYLTNLEHGAIICLASSQEEFRMKGANIISLLVELYHSLYSIAEKAGIADIIDLFSQDLFPYEEYREINPHKKLTAACPMINDQTLTASSRIDQL